MLAELQDQHDAIACISSAYKFFKNGCQQKKVNQSFFNLSPPLYKINKVLLRIHILDCDNPCSSWAPICWFYVLQKYSSKKTLIIQHPLWTLIFKSLGMSNKMIMGYIHRTKNIIELNRYQEHLLFSTCRRILKQNISKPLIDLLVLILRSYWVILK